MEDAQTGSPLGLMQGYTDRLSIGPYAGMHRQALLKALMTVIGAQFDLLDYQGCGGKC